MKVRDPRPPPWKSPEMEEVAGDGEERDAGDGGEEGNWLIAVLSLDLLCLHAGDGEEEGNWLMAVLSILIAVLSLDLDRRAPMIVPIRRLNRKIKELMSVTRAFRGMTSPLLLSSKLTLFSIITVFHSFGFLEDSPEVEGWG
ncbi:hypothetical protein CsSME_00024479 [Camellia sinensis var. sinensis]